LELPDTFSYATPNGGEHRWYIAPQGIPLTGNADYRAISGFDRRGGNSYVVVHTDTAPKRTDLVPAPLWLLDPATSHDRAGFKGNIREWLNKFGGGEVGEKVQAAINRIPVGDMSHSDMVAQQYNLIRIGAEGAPGVAVGLDELRAAWLARDPDAHTTPQQDWDWKFDEALESGIAKYGDELSAIAALPDYTATLSLLPSTFDIGLLIGAPTKVKKDWFDAVRALTRTELSENQIASLLWGSPKLKVFSADWGIEYVYGQITSARTSVALEQEPRENPTLAAVQKQTGLPPSAYTLLTDAERERLKDWPTFIDRYVAWVRSRVKLINEPYHRASAITCLSLASGMKCFLPEDEGSMGVNFFQLVLGLSGTGKSRALKMRTSWLSEWFAEDPGYDLGHNASIEALHEILLKRNQLSAFFNGDEADSVLEMWLVKEYLRGGIGAFTDWFEGRIGPMLRRGQVDEDRRGAIVHFEMAMFGTPEAVYDLLTEKLFKSGFLARFVWTIGDGKVETDDRFRVSRGSIERSTLDYDPAARAMVQGMKLMEVFASSRRTPTKETEAAIVRLEAAKKAMHYAVKDHQRWTILEPSITRLGDSIRKLAALLAFAEGRRIVYEEDMLAAIAQGEVWLANVVTVSDEVVASEFARNCDEVEAWVINHGGDVSLARLTNAFARWDLREFGGVVESLKAQARLTLNQSGTRIVWNQGKVE
jgi:Protein of unknown function (DUF3987)